MRMRCKPLLAVCLLLLSPLSAQAARGCKLIKYAELPVTMSGTRPLVAGTINGADARFLADSGAFFSSMGRESAARYKLQLRYLAPGFYVRGVGGAADAQLGIAGDFTLAGFNTTFHKIEFLVLDDASAPGVVQDPGGPVAIIGQNILGFHDAEYDLANGYIRLFETQDCGRGHLLAYWAKDQPVALMKIDSTGRHSLHLIGNATLDGKNIRVIFDTGAGRSVLTRKAAERVGFRPQSPDVKAAGLTGGIGRRRIETWIARFDSFDLGGEEVKNARLRVGDIDLSDEADMLLGADFFLSHRVYVANSQLQLYFTYNGGRVFDLSVKDEQQANAAPAGGQAGSGESPGTGGGDETGPGGPPGTPSADGATNLPATAAGAGAHAGSGNARADAPTDAASFRRRGAASAGRLQFRAAIADFDEAIRLEPNDAENYLQRASARVQQREFAAALSDYDQALRISPDSIPALLGRGELRLANGDEAGARPDFDRAGALAPADTGLSLHVAEIYLHNGRFEQSITLFDRWIAAHPADSRSGAAKIGRCGARAAWGRELSLALEDCNATVHRDSSSYALQTRGLVWLRIGNFDKAIADYQASLKLQPRNAFARYGLGLAERGKGMREQGDRDLQAANADSPSIAAWFKRMGLTP